MKKGRISKETLTALYEAAEKEDLKKFIEIIDSNEGNLPADLVEARSDPEVIEEAMKLIGEGLADIQPDGIRLVFEGERQDFPKEFH